jgi:hypothetical protein
MSEVRPKHNSTMVSDASPGTAQPQDERIIGSSCSADVFRTVHAHTGMVTSERPHPTIIDGNKRSDSGWFCVGFGVGGRLTRD